MLLLGSESISSDFKRVRALEFEMPGCSKLLEFKGSDPLEIA